MNSNIFYTWQGKNINIPADLLDAKTLSACMSQIAQNNIYSSSLSQFEKFCNESLSGNNLNCFPALFLYSLDNKVVGFLNIRVTFSDAEIDFICVDSQFLRRHIAEEIYNFFEEFILQKNLISNLFLEVGVNNLPAISFYKKIGFKKISIRKKYYKNNEDAWMMKKEVAL